MDSSQVERSAAQRPLHWLPRPWAGDAERAGSALLGDIALAVYDSPSALELTLDSALQLQDLNLVVDGEHVDHFLAKSPGGCPLLSRAFKNEKVKRIGLGICDHQLMNCHRTCCVT